MFHCSISYQCFTAAFQIIIWQQRFFPSFAAALYSSIKYKSRFTRVIHSSYSHSRVFRSVSLSPFSRELKPRTPPASRHHLLVLLITFVWSTLSFRHFCSNSTYLCKEARRTTLAYLAVMNHPVRQHCGSNHLPVRALNAIVRSEASANLCRAGSLAHQHVGLLQLVSLLVVERLLLAERLTIETGLGRVSEQSVPCAKDASRLQNCLGAMTAISLLRL